MQWFFLLVKATPINCEVLSLNINPNLISFIHLNDIRFDADFL